MAKVPVIPFSGHSVTLSSDEEPALTHVGARTPGGEYLRRFWHPIALVSELGDKPVPIKILGEKLILFRDKGGRLGLVHQHCSHRGASLEYGIIGERGIRCAYHGWAYDVDGTVLDTPSEAPGSRLRESFAHGAYRTREYAGLIFAYMGPADAVPDFPVYDSLTWPAGNKLVPYKLPTPCNWLQMHENAADPIHTAYLHTIVSGVQFTPAFGALPVLEFMETPLGILCIATRRCDDNLWIRASDVILPNIAQFGTGFVNGAKEKFALCAAFTRWIVPVDDAHCLVIGVRHFNEIMDPEHLGREDDIGLGKLDLLGQTDERPYSERQKSPGDYDAIVSQGPIVIRANEHRSPTDKGVVILRRQLRAGIAEVQAGRAPQQPKRYGADAVIPTYNNETILRVPPVEGDDKQVIGDFGHKICQLALDTADLPVGERQAYVERKSREMQAAGAFYEAVRDKVGA
jgi:nitrite reductase/ring-hydroxylating ferredoxin subunit